VIRPIPHKQVLVTEANPKDPEVGRENLKRGWPKGVRHRDERGKMTFLDYTVIDPSDPRTLSAAVVGGQTSRRVITTARATKRSRDPDSERPERAPARSEDCPGSG
jgi:hypothetical protein